MRRRHPDADRGSALLMTVIFTVFAGGIMLVLLAVLLSQMQAIQLARKNTRTGYSAQAGIQATLSVLRSNTKTVTVNGKPMTYGDPTKLPPKVSGSVDGGTNGKLRYSVDVAYYKVDPTNRTDEWLKENALKLPLSGKASDQPRFARLVSHGGDDAGGTLVDGVANRAITALYTFTTTNVNVPGGLIRRTGGSQCLKAVSASVGSEIELQSIASCTDDKLNLWVYDTDYRLKLASTLGTAEVLCITGRAWSSNGGSDKATLRPCAGSNAAAHGNQLWSWDAPGSWVGQNKTNDARTSRWLGLDGSRLADKGSGSGDFDPAPAVGAGGASYNTKQIVNYSEFGRCMDVTDENIGRAFMIVYPCKQDPTKSGASLKWNHKWHYTEPTGSSTTTAPQPIWVLEKDKTEYCLTSQVPGNADLRFTLCSPSVPSTVKTEHKFIRNSDTGNLLTSYTFQLAKDPSLCLTATRVEAPAELNQWSRVRLMPCNGSLTQKWNAPPQTSGSSLGSYKEIG